MQLKGGEKVGDEGSGWLDPCHLELNRHPWYQTLMLSHPAVLPSVMLAGNGVHYAGQRRALPGVPCSNVISSHKQLHGVDAWGGHEGITGGCLTHGVCRWDAWGGHGWPYEWEG